MAGKLSAEQQRRVDEILQFQRSVDHVAKLVAELEGNRAAKATFIDGGGIFMKIRGLNDGLSSLRMQLDVTLKQAMTPEPKQGPDQSH